MQEQIKLKTSRSGTTVTFFNTHLEPDGVTTFPAYVLFNQNNQPVHVDTFEVTPMWRDTDNSLVPLSNLNMPFITGVTRFEDLQYSLNSTQRLRIDTKWQQSMNIMFSGQSTSYTFFRDILLNDMFIDVALHRTFGTLDTLSIYNNLVNSFPSQESPTGTVFGRLVALQKIIDVNGNNITIPLRNVPVGVFNPTDEFPSPASSDENGNRITLNLSEAARAADYFNIQSYTADTTNYLHSGREFTAVPAYYKYVTTTNDEGEFVIHNVPTGTQTLFFEVDLFKQGLTQDEIALNFYPFPADDSPNIDGLPNLFFRQFPIDVVPTWGTLQTGYTEVNIKVELDLRKWATYFIEQVSFNELDFEELQRRGFITPLTIAIRNMARDGFPRTKVQIMEVPDMLFRDSDHVLLWDGEFVQLKPKAQFYTDGYHAFKLPANMYDPVGRKTDQNGEPMGSKGVWLAGYQLSMYYSDQTQFFRNTGSSKFVFESGSYVTRDHFNLNKNNADMATQNSAAQPIGGAFPYERKWDHIYPEPYDIPKVPSMLNPDFDVLNNAGKRWLERPKFLDGELIGNPFHQFLNIDNIYGGTGGYGAAIDETNNEWFKTDFSKYVTMNYMYRYENSEDPNSKYAVGYMPNNPDFPIQPGSSSVVGGEKYQRVECGYGYWLRPEGWPRIAHYTNNDGSEAIYPFDTKNPHTVVTPAMVNGSNEPLHSSYNYQTAFQFLSTPAGKKLFLDLGSETEMKEGGLDIYRIVDPSPKNLNLAIPAVTPTYTDYNFNRMFFHRGRGARTFMGIQNSGGGGGNLFWSTGGVGWEMSINEMTLRIRNMGVVTVEILGRRLAPGAAATFYGSELSETSTTFENAVLRLPGNLNFDYELFRYREARYEFVFQNVKLYNGEGGFFAGEAQQEGPTHDRALFVYSSNAGPESNVPMYWIRSYLTNVNTACDGRATVIVPGMAFAQPDQRGGRGDPFWGARFWPWQVDITCPYGVPYREDSNGE